MPPLKVVELFAGVGGFRLGLEKSGDYQVVWSNQWEPKTKTQHASMIYEARFGDAAHSNENIENVPTDAIPDHDVMVAGFPCQDYSVASTLQNAKGLIGKKGVLWWSIYRILKEKKVKPSYLIFENVDRLLKSPASQRGRDFAVMLKCLEELGYAVEWRVVNAADYGMPQRRRRVFFMGYHRTTPIYKRLKNAAILPFLLEEGIFAKAFPAKVATKNARNLEFAIEGGLVEVSENFSKGKKKSPFENTGLMFEGVVFSCKTEAIYDGKAVHLGDILEKGKVEESFYISEEEVERWQYFKGSKKELRTTPTGYQYMYTEGGMTFPDALDKPSRTIITGEGGKAPSRFKHVIQTPEGLRRLTPLELERLNMFPDHHTKLKGVSDTKRAFLMGNALVVGVVQRLGAALKNQL